jgi:RNA polymerase sigma factor (sigma-70 family)
VILVSNQVYHVNELIESHMHLVGITIEKFFTVRDRHDKDELMSIGYEALVHAAQKYDPEKCKFSTFVVYKVRWAILNHLRRERRRAEIIEFSSLDRTLEGGDMFHEIVGDETSLYEEKAASNVDIERLLSCLDEEEKEILLMSVGLDARGKLTQKEIGEFLGISKAKVYRSKKKIIAQLCENGSLGEVGVHGWMAHVAVIAAEITFIMGGLLGVAVVTWSNVAAGWSYGWVGIILGATTPLSLIIAESILSRAILQQQEEEVVESLEHQRLDDVSETIVGPEPATLEEMVNGDSEWRNNQPQVKQTMAFEIAKGIYEESGQLPGRVRLAKEAGCSNWEARKALAQFKEQIN